MEGIHARMGKSHLTAAGPQPFWLQGLVSWKTVFHGPGSRGMISTSHLLCTLLLLHQLRLRPSGSRS